MKHVTLRNALLLTVALLVGAGVVAQAGDKEQAKGLAMGAKAPMADLEMKGVDGKEYSIAGVKRKKGTLVLFSCNGCPWVKAWEDRMIALGNEAMEHEIGVIEINSNDPNKSKADRYEAMVERAEEGGMKYPYVVDDTSDLARVFYATRTPEAFLFDAKGNLVYHGTIDDNAKKPAEVKHTYLADAVHAMVEGESIEVSETKALGCGIKFRSASTAEKTETDTDAKSSS